jgi:divalent metal cation (Fe/Co/Zn/Cd) transporter
MSNSVSISIATNSVIALSKGFGWFVTGSPTLFAETIHSLADVANQVLLKVGEVRGRGPPDREHPFGRGYFSSAAASTFTTARMRCSRPCQWPRFRHSCWHCCCSRWRSSRGRY